MSDNGNEEESAHVRWFRSVERDIKADYDRLHQEARNDPQRAGHGAEETWARILRDWLPPEYEIVTRKYIVPEVGDKSFETDVVVLQPSYPVPLRNRTEILAGGVAAAFSVKLTLDAAGIRDGVERAVSLRRGLARRFGAAREEMGPAFPVGILAHSHSWKSPGSTPADNVATQLETLDYELVQHPRECLDFLCIADLGLWWAGRMPYMLPRIDPQNMALTIAAIQRGDGSALTMISRTDPAETYTAVASLITHLIIFLSYTNPALRPFAQGLRSIGAVGDSRGKTREWKLDEIFTEIVRKQLQSQAFSQGSDFWGSAFF